MQNPNNTEVRCPKVGNLKQKGGSPMSTENPEFTLPSAPDMWKMVAEKQKEVFERNRQERIKSQLSIVKEAIEKATKELEEKASIGILDKKERKIVVKVRFTIKDAEIDTKEMEPEVIKALTDAGWSAPVQSGSCEGLVYTFEYDPSKRK